VTAQEIFDALRTEGRAVGIASVYRGVDQLADLGLLQRVDVGDGVTRFQPALPDGEHHHHLACDDCGKVEAFHDEPLEQALTALSRRAGYELADATLTEPQFSVAKKLAPAAAHAAPGRSATTGTEKLPAGADHAEKLHGSPPWGRVNLGQGP
jgi:Fur family ferric uptake transcriptional regulator